MKLGAVHRALVVSSDAVTGQIWVQVPTVTGNRRLAISYIGRQASGSGSWPVPAVGEAILVTFDDASASNVFWLTTGFDFGHVSSAGLAPLETRIRAIAVSQSLTSGVRSEIVWTHVDYDPDGMYSAGEIHFARDGWWGVTAWCQLSGAVSSGQFFIEVEVNPGTGIIPDVTPTELRSHHPGDTHAQIYVPILVVEGNEIEFNVLQGSGGALNVTAASATARWLGEYST